MDLHWQHGINVIEAGIEQQEKERAWQLYCSIYPYFTKDTYQEFSKWYEQRKQSRSPRGRPITSQKKKKEEEKTAAQLYEWAEQVKAADTGRR